MKVLFVCTGNTCRSPMAEGFLRAIGHDKGINVKVQSAGIAAFDGSPAAENAIKAMDAIGIDIRGHKSSLLHRGLVQEADLILTMSKSHRDIILENLPQAKGKTFTLIEYAEDRQGDVADPFGGALRTYLETRDEIAYYINKIVDKKL